MGNIKETLQIAESPLYLYLSKLDAGEAVVDGAEHTTDDRAE